MRKTRHYTGYQMRCVRQLAPALAADMSAKDHNKTIVGIHIVVGSFFAFWLLASPWIITKNFHTVEQLPQAVAIFTTVAALSALMFTTAFAMHRTKPIGRTLALYSAALLVIFLWPAGMYTWWFMHTAGAKQLYGISEES
jgi:hypothetical protein